MSDPFLRNLIRLEEARIKQKERRLEHALKYGVSKTGKRPKKRNKLPKAYRKKKGHKKKKKR